MAREVVTRPMMAQRTLGLGVPHVAPIQTVEQVEEGKQREKGNVHLPVDAPVHRPLADCLCVGRGPFQLLGGLGRGDRGPRGRRVRVGAV